MSANTSAIQGAAVPRSTINGTPRKSLAGSGNTAVREVATGEVSYLSRANARDLVEHSQGQWTYDLAAKSAPDTVQVTAAAKAEVTDTNAGAASPLELDPALDALNGLRQQLIELGGEPDARWGKKRLAEEIAKRTGAA